MDYCPVHTLLLSLLTLALLCQCGLAVQCSQCDTDNHGMACILNPPAPKQCPDFDYCITVAQYSLQGKKLESLTRTCSPIFLPDMCMPGRDKATGFPVNLCYTVCHKDGCNLAHSAKTFEALKFQMIQSRPLTSL